VLEFRTGRDRNRWVDTDLRICAGRPVTWTRLTPRKQRTRQHVIADQSVNYVERFIIDEGHTTQRLTPDYGYDLILFTFDEEGYAEPRVAFLQLKASEALTYSKGRYLFALDIRDYNLWMAENAPVFLVLFDATRRRAYWVCVQHYFENDVSRQPKKGAKQIRIEIPDHQTISRRGVAKMRRLKNNRANLVLREEE
jgi:hypothetical protein